jgi:tetratricopeptide (TPR) repeat protein
MQLRRWRTQFGRCCNTHDHRIRSDIGWTRYGPPIQSGLFSLQPPLKRHQVRCQHGPPSSRSRPSAITEDAISSFRNEARTEDRPGRNGPCPCGSGRKFKLCCGRRRATAVDGKWTVTDTSAASGLTWVRNGAGTKLNVGPLVATPRHRQFPFEPPDPLFAEKGASDTKSETIPRGRIVAAERYRQLGNRLLKAEKFTAAIAALRHATELDPRPAEAYHALGRALLYAGRFAEAADSLRLATISNGDLASAYHDLASALEGLGRHREAIAACRRAVELAPLLVEGYRTLGNLLESAGDPVEAAECFHRAAATAPNTMAGRVDLVRALLLQGDLREAEGCLRQAIDLDPGIDELHKILGEILAKQGRFAEAIKACERALELNPLQVPAFLTAVRAGKCTEADRPRLTRMLSTLRHPSIGDAHRVFLHFAIGKFLDDLGEYCEAMRHFDKANRIRKRNRVFDRAALSEVLTRLIGRFSAAFFSANKAFGANDETPLFIVGMPRSGTTLIEQIVSSHPEITAGEELFFWSRRASSRGIAEATSLTPESGRALATEYISLLRKISPCAARVTDKQTFNFQQLGLIHLLLPKARIIHCRRNPIDTCLSMYCTYFKGSIPFVTSRADLAFAYGQYVRIMDHWRTVLPSDRFLEVDYETLVGDREAVTRKLITFTGLGWHDACLQPERNGRAVTTASLWQARQPVFRTSVERWRRYEPWLGELRQLLGTSATHPKS